MDICGLFWGSSHVVEGCIGFGMLERHEGWVACVVGQDGFDDGMLHVMVGCKYGRIHILFIRSSGLDAR